MLPVLVEEDILRLQVSVYNVTAVTVIDRGEDLLNYICSILLAKVLLRRNPLKQLASVAKSENNQKTNIRENRQMKGVQVEQKVGQQALRTARDG